MSTRKAEELAKWLDDTREARMKAHEIEEQVKDGYYN